MKHRNPLRLDLLSRIKNSIRATILWTPVRKIPLRQQSLHAMLSLSIASHAYQAIAAVYAPPADTQRIIGSTSTASTKTDPDPVKAKKTSAKGPLFAGLFDLFRSGGKDKDDKKDSDETSASSNTDVTMEKFEKMEEIAKNKDLFSMVKCSEALGSFGTAQKSYKDACGELGISGSLTDCHVQVQVCSDVKKRKEPNYKAMRDAKPGDVYYTFLESLYRDEIEDDEFEDDEIQEDLTNSIEDAQESLSRALRGFGTKTRGFFGGSVSQKVPTTMSRLIGVKMSQYRCDKLIPANIKQLEKLHDRQEKKAEKIQDQIKDLDETISDIDDDIRESKKSLGDLDNELLEGQEKAQGQIKAAENAASEMRTQVFGFNMDMAKNQIDERRDLREQLYKVRQQIIQFSSGCQLQAYNYTQKWLINIRDGTTPVSSKIIANLRKVLKNIYDQEYKACMFNQKSQIDAANVELKALDEEYQARKSLATMQSQEAANSLRQAEKSVKETTNEASKQFQKFLDLNIAQKKKAISATMELEKLKGSKESERMALKFQYQYELQRASMMQASEEEEVDSGGSEEKDELRSKAIATVLHTPDFTSEIIEVDSFCRCGLSLNSKNTANTPSYTTTSPASTTQESSPLTDPYGMCNSFAQNADVRRIFNLSPLPKAKANADKDDTKKSGATSTVETKQ